MELALNKTVPHLALHRQMYVCLQLCSEMHMHNYIYTDLPRSIELHHPNILPIQHHTLKIIRVNS